MSFVNLLGVWRNAVRRLAQDDAGDRQIALGVINAIEREWDTRGLERLDSADWFKWPDTDASAGDGSFSFPSGLREGMFHYLEYRVGRTYGEPQPVRRVILSRIFEGGLPPVFLPDYMQQWSDPRSARRLQKMAEAIAAFCRNAKRKNDSRYDDAIRSWEDDLGYLHDKYYAGHFHFGWPSTSNSGLW